MYSVVSSHRYRDPLAKKVSQPEVDRICIYMSFLSLSKLYVFCGAREKETFLAFSAGVGKTRTIFSVVKFLFSEECFAIRERGEKISFRSEAFLLKNRRRGLFRDFLSREVLSLLWRGTNLIKRLL